MATVRFSDTLKETIRGNAKAMFKDSIAKAKADVPAHWADKMYECFFPADVIAKFNALPDYAMTSKSKISFSGFTDAPDDYFQTAEYKTKAYTCDDVELHFSTNKRWPNTFDSNVTGFTEGWREGKAKFNDTRWDWLKPEFKEYVRKIFEAEAKQEKFLEGVNKLMETYSTLAPAIKAWQPLWDLLDEETKERHTKIVERKRKDSSDLDVDLNSMTAAVTFSKLTR